jgi:phage terminase large subunit
MSECHKMSEAELEKAVDDMIDQMASEITPTKLIMSPDAVKQRVIEILKKRGMWIPTEVKKGGSRSKKSKKSKKSKRRRSRSTRRR